MLGGGYGSGFSLDAMDEELPETGASQQMEVGMGPLSVEIPLTSGFKEPCKFNGVNMNSWDPLGSLKNAMAATTRGGKIKASLSGRVTQKWCMRF